jgi:hypothetical protein
MNGRVWEVRMGDGVAGDAGDAGRGKRRREGERGNTIAPARGRHCHCESENRRGGIKEMLLETYSVKVCVDVK